MANSSNARMDAYAQFEKWLGSQPFWLQDAAFCIYHGLPIDDKQIQVYVDMCLAEIQKERPSFRHINNTEIEASGAEKRMAVLSLSDIVGVNALAPDAKLDFAPEGVTVVYGLNGAGKSGFMRIFKQVSGSPYEEPIQPNVFAKRTDRNPSCIFRFCIDDQELSTTCELSGKTLTPILSGCDVFDTRISNAYINSPNNPSYQPFVFTVLSELSAIADRINLRMQDMARVITPISVQLPDGLSIQDDTSWIQTLTADTVIPWQFTEWTEDQEKRLAELPSLLDTNNVSQRLQLLRTQLQALLPIQNDLIKSRDYLKSGEISSTFDRCQTTKACLDVAKKLFSDTADELDRISLTSRDWKTLWSSAKKYYETVLYNNGCKHFGEEGSVCPLCHQTITDKTALRFKNVNDYINGSCNEDYQASLAAFKNAILLLCNRMYTQEQVKTAIVGIIGEEKTEEVCKIYSVLATIKAESNVDKAYALLLTVDMDEAVTILKDISHSLESEISTLETTLKDEKRIIMQQELEHLRCCKWIYNSLQAIQTTVNNAKRKKNLVDAMSLVSTNRITFEANKLAESLITAAYIERFTTELSRLAPNIKVKLEKAASRKGNSPYKVALDVTDGNNVKTEDILSEGEQRIVALAAFFADATGRKEYTPLIIDDPISSLDYNYEDAATKRIVELAQSRQIIVFTHRISLLVGIKDLCESEGVLCQEIRIRSAYKGKGVPDFEGNYYGKIPNQLNEMLGRIGSIRKQDPDSIEYQDAIGRICQQFRICVERTVEDELLFGMVKRFSRRIRTDGLIQKLPAITKDDCAIIDSMMMKYSFMEHSQPSETPPQYFGIDEIHSDIKAYADWLSDFRNRTKKL